MCGICGFVSKDDVDKSIIHLMNNEIIHRGPDSEGFFNMQTVSFAMRRLKIIDLETGDQPIVSDDKNYSIVFNGEIYNYREIKKELIKRGREFKSNSDTEVILQAYMEWGTAVFSKLNGMFAIAIYDKNKKFIVISRDRIGIKPLFYYKAKNTFVFGSEIKSILKFPTIKREMDIDSLGNLLHLKYIPSNKTMFKGITKLEPGHFMVVNFEGSVQKTTKYWDIQSVYTVSEEYGYPAAKSNLKEVLTESVRKRMISDVPLGAFLSGGIDSGIIVGLMKELSGAKIKTFTIGFDEKSFNELKWARMTAKLHGTEHYEDVVKPVNILDLIRELVHFIDEPIGDYSIIPTYYVSKYTKQHVTVALSGIGADELFAGYERYWIEMTNRMRPYIPLSIIKPLFNSLPVSSSKKSVVMRLKKLFNEMDKPLYEQYQGIVSLLKKEKVNKLINHNYQSTKLFDFSEIFDDIARDDFIRKASYVDLKTILRNDYLVKDDRMSMANSLEVRVPFLDHNVVEFAAKIKSKDKLRGRKTKFILKETFNNYLPKEVLSRGKYGFEAPFSIWIKNELKDDIKEIFYNSKLVEVGVINKTELMNVLGEHFNSINNHAKLIFTLLTLEFWYQEHFINNIN